MGYTRQLETFGSVPLLLQLQLQQQIELENWSQKTIGQTRLENYSRQTCIN